MLLGPGNQQLPMKTPLVLRIVGYAAVFGVTTVLTQVGGVIFVGAWLIFRRRVFAGYRRPRLAGLGAATLTYIFCILTLVPLLAKFAGRRPLPWVSSPELPLAPRSIV